jgi:hypothetical protein
MTHTTFFLARERVVTESLQSDWLLERAAAGGKFEKFDVLCERKSIICYLRDIARIP